MLARTRPVGITIISIILFIQGILELLGAILLFTAAGGTAASGHSVVSTAATVTAVIALILALITLLLAWGLWTLRAWAFWGIVVVEVINLINGIIGWTQGNNSFFTILFGIVVPIVILLYMFLDRNVRAAFRT